MSVVSSIQNLRWTVSLIITYTYISALHAMLFYTPQGLFELEFVVGYTDVLLFDN